MAQIMNSLLPNSEKLIVSHNRVSITTLNELMSLLMSSIYSLLTQHSHPISPSYYFLLEESIVSRHRINNKIQRVLSN